MWIEIPKSKIDPDGDNIEEADHIDGEWGEEGTPCGSQ